ncbi:membrane protein [Peribacillus kribbensis]|uniref:membrane protein n=1 Tax=Peribacillus kribbensis TaxID=356658 RepID=UPI0003FA4C17|nr:membrane protein [Peribacillus kribbensis]
MHIFSTFETTNYLELAVSTLEKRGIQKECIFAVPLDNRTEDRKLIDTIHRSDGTSLIDIGMALGTALSVIGASIGFELYLGPIIWGLIFAFIGFVLGVGIRLWIEKRLNRKKRVLKGKHSEVILIINCAESQTEVIEKILWDHLAVGVAKVR